MIDDVFKQALAAICHHLDEAGVDYTVDEGEVQLDGHRLGLAIASDGCVAQGNHTLVPLDIAVHLDGDNGDRFRVGTLGIGADRTSALSAAVAEWHLLALGPLLAALGAPVENRRAKPQTLAGWDLFAGRVGIRGAVPPALRGDGPFYRALVARLDKVIAKWDIPTRPEYRSIYVMATRGPEGCEVQAGVDGVVHEELIAALAELPWPASDETYLYKQMFVLRGGGE